MLGPSLRMRKKIRVPPPPPPPPPGGRHPPLDPHMRQPVERLFVWFDSLHCIDNLSVIKGRVFLGWTSTKLGLVFLAQLKRTQRSEPGEARTRPSWVEHSTTEPLRTRWNDATLDLLNRELFGWFILTLSVKELTFNDLTHFIFARGVK